MPARERFNEEVESAIKEGNDRFKEKKLEHKVLSAINKERIEG